MIHFIDIDPGNWRLDLKVAESQKNYVANSAVMLARAYAYRDYNSRAFVICDDETPVGMGMYHDCPELDAYDLSQIFIDERYQGRGYGKAAAKLVLEAMKQEGKYGKVVLCYIAGNDAAKALYEAFGFVEIDRDEDEIIMELRLQNDKKEKPMIEIETPRLLLRKFQGKDKQDMFEILSDEQWCLDDGGYHAFTQMGEEFENLFQMFLEQQRYAIVLKEENKAIGIINMMEADRAVPAYELGFGINREYQQMGYGYEAVSHVIDTWFGRTDTELFTVSHYPFNTASRKLIEKLGFTYEGTTHKSHYHCVLGPVDLVHYFLERNSK